MANAPCRLSSALRLACAAGAVAVLVCTGCEALGRSEKPILTASSAAQVDPVALRYDLSRFADRTLGAVAGAADTVAAKTQDRSVRELTLRWKVRTADVLSDLLSDPDPRPAFVRTWVTLAEDRHRLAGADVAPKLGGEAATVDQVLAAAEADLVAIGRRHFGDARMDAAEAEVATLSSDPTRASDVLSRLAGTAPAAGRTAKGESNPLMTLATAPVAAVSSLWGVADTPTAVGHVAAAVSGFTGMAKQLPERMRWELEMLLLNAGWPDLSSDLRANMQQLVTTTQQLPADIRAEVQILLDAAEQSQPQLQKTLGAAQRTSQDITVAIEKADGLVKTADATVKEVTAAAQALESAAGAIQALVVEARGPSEGAPGPKEGAEPVTIAQVTALAEQTERIVGELRSLVADLQQPMPETAAINQTVVRAETLVDYLTWRVLIVIAAVLVAAVLYKLAATAVSRRWQRKGEDPACHA